MMAGLHRKPNMRACFLGKGAVMVDRRYRDSAWGQPPAPMVPEAAKPCDAPPTAVQGDQWGRPAANVGTNLPVAPPAPVGPPVAASERDSKGRFLAGNSGNGGRKRGSRNRLTDQFLTVIADDFAEHGAEALAKLREKDPAAYLQLVGGLVPRELIAKHETEHDYSEMTLEEVQEFLERQRMNREVAIALEEMKKY